MSEISLFLLYGLIVYRLSRMIAWEQGPFDCFIVIRSFLFHKLPRKDNRDHWIYKGIQCPLCISFWIGIAFGLWQWQSVLYGIALSGIATILIRHERT